MWKRLIGPDPDQKHTTGGLLTAQIADELEQTRRQIKHQALNIGMLAPSPPPPPVTGSARMRDALLARINWQYSPDRTSPVTIVHCARKGDVIHIVAETSDTITVLQDGVELFPSDALVTKLRLLEG